MSKTNEYIDYMAYIPYNEGVIMSEYTIFFYEKENGECPVKDFLLKLDNKTRAKVLMLLKILQEKGNNLREPYSKHLKDGIFEMRVISGNTLIRVLYFFLEGKRIFLTNGFVKKTSKTPEREIKLAMKYREDYMGRMCK